MAEIRAVIAEDEQVLRRDLADRLGALWPELTICGEAPDGREALRLIEEREPQVAFLDIRMPGLTGLEVARRVAGQCRVVFLTAYDRYAVEAFEAEAVDYLLKPVTDERLAQTVERLRSDLTAHLPSPDLKGLAERLAETLRQAPSQKPLRWIRASHRDGIRLIPVDEVVYFQARDKYTAVVTPDAEFLIRKSIRDLVSELDPSEFWQIHRGTVVNTRCIAQVSRGIGGRRALRLSNRPETLIVSRTHGEQFREM